MKLLWGLCSGSLTSTTWLGLQGCPGPEALAKNSDAVQKLYESQGLVSRKTTVSPPYKHPDVTKKHGLHFQKENFRALVSFTMS